MKNLLENLNDGKRKTFFCVTVNLPTLEDVQSVVSTIEEEITSAMELKKEQLLQ